MYELTQKTKEEMSKYQAKREKQPNAKLSMEEVQEIRKILATRNFRQWEIAQMYGVGQPTISKIKNGEIWSEIK